MTVSEYQQLDKVEPTEVTGFARVKTTPDLDVYEYIGLDANGWLVRAELEAARYKRRALQTKYEQFRGLPYLRLVDDVTGYSFPDPENDDRRTMRARVVNARPVDAPQAALSPRQEDQDGAHDTPHLTEGRHAWPTLIPDDSDAVDVPRSGPRLCPTVGWCVAVTIGANGARCKDREALRPHDHPPEVRPRRLTLSGPRPGAAPLVLCESRSLGVVLHASLRPTPSRNPN